MPFSFNAAIASERTMLGCVPALKTSNLLPAISRNKPSAIWLRAEFPVQRIKTRLIADCGLRIVDLLCSILCYSSFEFSSQRKSIVAANAPNSCAKIKAGASFGRIPANVSETVRASVTAGFANDVEDVNQYAAVM